MANNPKNIFSSKANVLKFLEHSTKKFNIEQLMFFTVTEWKNDQIKIITEEHKGGNAARNKGFSESEGKYIKFLDSDDLLEPGILTAQYEQLESTGTDVSYGDWEYLCEHDDSMNGGRPPDTSRPRNREAGLVTGYDTYIGKDYGVWGLCGPRGA